MIYMVEMDLIDRSRRVEWDAWYLAHTKMLLAMPGFHATQRFECLHDAPAPFVALHHVDGPAFFESEPYRNQAGPAGTGEWRTRHANWSRNLFARVEETPSVPLGGGLLVVEEAGEAHLPDGLDVTWMTAAGLDRDVERRGLAVADDLESFRPLVGTEGMRVMKPLIPRLTKEDL
jgi:hypothetical protein